MANLFSKIASLLNEKPSDSIMDDNVAIAAEDNNSYISPVVLGARNAYDTLHTLMAPLIKGKKSSLKQIRKWLDDWEKRLQQIEDMYKELLAKMNDMGADFGAMFDLEFAKEAWEIVQDTPILRRYMGEANYWLLYDTVGILATQPGQLAGDLLAGAKEAIRQAILALLSMTDGLLCLESYLGMIQQYWGALYLKITPIPLLDSIVPNVTTAYWYKPAIPSQSNGEQHSISLRNAPPGQGFTPLPLPVPDPIMVTRQASYIGQFDYQNPDTWYLNGTPYYLPNTMNLLERALQYWSSSYTNEFMPALNNFYPRNDYGEGSAHPLRVGHTFEQLDTSKMSLNGTNVVMEQGSTSEEGNSTESNPSIKELFADVFTEDVVYYMTTKTWTDADGEEHYGWQYAYELAYNWILNFILAGFTAYEEEPTTISRFRDLQANDPSGSIWAQLSTWASPNDNLFRKALEDMYVCWQHMVIAYSAKIGLPLADAYNSFFDAVMGVFVKAGQTIKGADGSLTDDETYMVCPSFLPINAFGYTGGSTEAGVPFVAYKTNLKTNQITYISSGADVTAEGDSVNVMYKADDIGFIMFPSDNTTEDAVYNRVTSYGYVANYMFTTMINVSEGLHKAEAITKTIQYPLGTNTATVGYTNGDSINEDASVMEQSYPQDASVAKPGILGSLPDAVYKHKSCILGIPKYLDENKGLTCIGNIFFPDGKIPLNVASAVVPKTFVMHYQAFVPETNVAHYEDPDAEQTLSAVEELADVVGYSINKGREIKFPCFGIYGDLLSMQSWHYTEMPYLEFATTYSVVKSGSSLYYEKNDPSHIVFYHSSYTSQTRQMQMAVIHEYLESTTKSYGAGDTYTFYVFPTESISVSKLTDSPSLGKFLSTDAESPSGEAYHYITMRNPIPKCAKYVDPEKWSIMDIIHEMYLLASNLAGLCGDNGERLKQLQDDLSEFRISTPQFVGQLPENNGQFVPFRFEIFKDYADAIEKLVNSIYDFRAKIIAATEAW